MKEKVLRILAYSKLLESNLNEDSMYEYTVFIDKASPVELKGFIMDGEVPETDDITEKIINDRFENFIRMEGIVSGLKIAAVIAAIAAARKFFKQKTEAAEDRICSDRTGFDRRLCIGRVKNKVYDEQMARLNSIMGKCEQTQNPEQCKRLVSSAKASVQNKIEKNKARYTQKDIEKYTKQ